MFDINSFFNIIIFSTLAVFSIISVSIIIERFFFFKKNNVNVDFYRAYFPDKIIELKNILNTRKTNTFFNSIILNILKMSVINRIEIKERLDSQFTEIYMNYHKRVNFLGIAAKLSTLIGLFGTVTGMISSFNSIVSSGISTASIVANGISQALLTTAAGLVVAIPATFFYEYFNERVEHEIRKMEITTSDLLSILIDRSKSWSSYKWNTKDFINIKSQ